MRRSIRTRMIASALVPLIIAMVTVAVIALGGYEDVVDDIAQEPVPRSSLALADRIRERLSIYGASTAAILLLGGTLSAALSVASANRALRRIKNTANGARSIAEGEFDFTIPDVAEPEIQVLVEEFNSLGRSLLESRTELEQRVARRTSELSTLLRVSHSVASTLELKPLLNLILEHLEAVVDYSGAAIMTLEDDSLRVIAYRGPIPQEEAANLSFRLADARANKEVIERREWLVIPDVGEETALARAFKQMTQQPLRAASSHMRSWMGVPLIFKDHVIAMLCLHHSLPNYYTPQHATLAAAFADQVAVALENARLFEEAQELATVKERQRLARELHDSVTQSLYAITLYATAACRNIDAGQTERVVEHVRQLSATAQEALREMRLFIFELRPPELEHEGLAAALESRLKGVETRVGLETEFDTNLAGRLALHVEQDLYRIAQEALNNALKHAQANAIKVSLQRDESMITLLVSDDGIGFDPATQAGIGLRGIAERAGLLGGSLEIDSAPAKGTTVKVSFDLQSVESD